MPHYYLYILIFFVSTIGSAIQAATGFGYGIFVMSVLPFFLPYSDALCATGLVAIFTSALIAWRHRDAIQPRLLVIPVAVYLVSSILGTFFLKQHADETLRRILGGFLILLSLYLIFFSHKIKAKAGPRSGIAAGFLGGIMGSVFSMGGPPIAIYMLSAANTTSAYIANIQVYFLCTNTYITALRFANGMLNRNVMVYVLCGLLGIFAGAKAGDILFRRLDAKSLRLLVYCFMILMGFLFLFFG